MEPIKTYTLDHVQKGMQFPYSGTYWKVKAWDDNSNMWICKNIFDGSDYTYFTEEKILEIVLNR